MKKNHNRYTFGLGTVGRDMVYTMFSMFLMYYLTDILNLDDTVMWWITGAFFFFRVFDAVNDPVMGIIVDNTRSRFGKFKPWIALGALVSGIFTVLMFTDFHFTGAAFVVSFCLLYLLWEIGFTANDIAYWSMLPALSVDQKERENTGAFARICANVGMFAVVVGILPITTAMGKALGNLKTAFTLFAMAVVLLMWLGQCITLFWTKEPRGLFVQEESTTLRGMARAIFQNDQLLITAVAMCLFQFGYMTTTSFGVYYFKYVFGNENMYSIFAAILGVSQITALAVFPLFSKKYDRRTLYTASTASVVLGYVVFFLSPANMLFVGISGILLFVGEAFIQLLILVFLTDTIEYGQWKLGKRNESVTFSIQPFINKMGGAVSSGIVGATVILSGINAAQSPADVTPHGLAIFKFAMFILPLLFIVAGYLVYRFKFKIDKTFYDKLLADLRERGQLGEEKKA